MVFAYLFRNLFLTIFLFFRHWYVDGFNAVFGRALGIVRAMERRLALRINLHFLFKPLYQEYNIYGYVMGFLFRGLRIAAGLLGYLLIMFVAAAAYIIWASVPVFLVYRIIIGK